MDLFRLLFAPFVPPLIYGLICIPLSQFAYPLSKRCHGSRGNFSRGGNEVTQVAGKPWRGKKTIVIISTIGMPASVSAGIAMMHHSINFDCHAIGRYLASTLVDP